MSTAILKCDSVTCRSDYQDKKYGSKMRVMNHKGKMEDKSFRCTVCGNEKSKTSAENKRKK